MGHTFGADCHTRHFLLISWQPAGPGSSAVLGDILPCAAALPISAAPAWQPIPLFAEDCAHSAPTSTARLKVGTAKAALGSGPAQNATQQRNKRARIRAHKLNVRLYLPACEKTDAWFPAILANWCIHVNINPHLHEGLLCLIHLLTASFMKLISLLLQ